MAKRIVPRHTGRGFGLTVIVNDHQTTPRDDGNEVLLEALRGQFEVEEGRAQGLNARGVGLAGFGSVILSLLTLSVSNELRADTAVGLPPAAKYILIAALWFLVVAVGVIVLGVMRPRLPKDLSGAELLALQGRDPDDVRQQLVVRLKEAVERHREINNTKAGFLKWAAYSVSVAVGLSAVSGTLIALD